MAVTELASAGPVEAGPTHSERFAEDERRWSRWMALANAGDADAYRRLMDELSGATEAYLVAHFGRSEMLEDCVQDVLLATHRARSTYDPARPFRPWFFTIVRNKMLDHLRRGNVRRGESAGSEPLDGVAEIGVVDPGDLVDGHSILSRLDPRQREALLLTKFEGCSMEEAASRAGVSRTAMKTRVHRALRAVRKVLEREGVSG